LLFGAVAGTLVTIASSVLSAVLSLLVGRAAGRAPLDRHAADRERLGALLALARHHGTLAVALQRLAPFIPDAPVSYAFGAAGITVWQIAAGTFIGSAPRAFSYTAIGASLDDPGSRLALAGWAGVAITGLVGLLLARRYLRGASGGTGRRPAPTERP
jgi:uncharacterized membrane protein YdjX (TVP38/TMEM64 family)